MSVINHTQTDNQELANLSRGCTESYTKEQLHEAFTVEVNNRKVQEKRFNQLQHEQARLRADNLELLDKVKHQEEYIDFILEEHLRLHIEKFVGIVPGPNEPEASLDYFFNHPHHFTLYTSTGGYICYVEESTELFVEFMWYNPLKTRQEMKEQTQNIKALYEYAKSINKPIRYTGTKNVLRNHSAELEPGLWQVRFDDHFDDSIIEYKESLMTYETEIDKINTKDL